jgi:hypothetical protein
MLPETAVQYSITKDPNSVMIPLKKMPSSMREKITDVIDSLQTDPRPPKHEMIPGLANIATIKLAITQGWYLMYQVDDQLKKVYVLIVGRF